MSTLHRGLPRLVWHSWQLCGIQKMEREPNENLSNSLWNTFEPVDWASEPRNELKHPPPKQMHTHMDQRSRWQSFQEQQQRGRGWTDEPTYHVVAQACKFVILVVISMSGDDGGSLAERETNEGVVNSKPKMKRVLDCDKIWPIFLNLEQFRGVRLSDRRRIVILLLLSIEKQLTNEGADNTRLMNNEFEGVLGVVHNWWIPHISLSKYFFDSRSRSW